MWRSWFLTSQQWAPPPATMPEGTPPQGRPPLGRPPPQQPFQAFTPTPPAARAPSYGTETPRVPRLGAPTGRPAMVPLSQVQCHRCRGFGHNARACPSPDRTMGPRAPPVAAPGPTGAVRSALRPSRMQYAMAAIAGTPGETRWCRTTPAPTAEASPSAMRPGTRNRTRTRRWTHLPPPERETCTGRAASGSAAPCRPHSAGSEDAGTPRHGPGIPAVYYPRSPRL